MFKTVIVYLIISPAPISPSPLSITCALFVTSIDFSIVAEICVGSLVVFPSSSIPSSEVSDTLLVCPGLLAITFKLLSICPEFAAEADIWNVALYLSLSAMLSVP